MTCEQCGGEYAPRVRTSPRQYGLNRFCSDLCCRRWEYAHPKTKPVTCGHCGEVFTPKDARLSKFCSRECAFAKKTAKAIADRNSGHWTHLWFKDCAICGVRFMSHNPKASICSNECRDQDARRTSRARNEAESTRVGTAFTCRECGAPFTVSYGDKRDTYCSDACSRRSGGRNAKHTRRARGGRYRAIVYLRWLVDRDGGACRLCGLPVDIDARVPSDDAPTIDHVIPLSRGGAHHPSNVQLAHFRCNWMKGNTLPVG